MEVIGVIAAVPELLKMVKRTAVAVGQISSKTRIGKTAEGVHAQLELLAGILGNIQRQEEKRILGRSQNSRLAPVIRDIQDEVVSLQRLVDKVEGPHGGPSLLKRAQLVFTGFEKQFKERSDRLDSLKSLLQLYLSESAAQSAQRSQLRKMLRPATINFIPKKLDGTGEWIWSQEAFKRWTGQAMENGVPSSSSAKTPAKAANESHLHSKILLIYGVKGCGKSVLAASTVNGLRDRGNTTLFFSFWAGHGQERRAEAMLRSLLWQLLHSLPEERQNDHIPRLLESQTDLKDAASLALEIQKLGKHHQSDIYCVLDGIDESADDWNDAKGGPLNGLIELLQSTPQLRLLLVGRQSSLRTALRRWPLCIELTRDLVQDDVTKFISSELDNCPNITDGTMRSTILRELESKSTVMFLWIELVFKELRSPFSPSEITSTLGRLPNELDREYCRLFSMVMERLGGRPNNPSIRITRARRLLSLIVGASRPLTVEELRLAYAFSSPSTSPESCYQENLINEEGIIDGCGDFITTNGNLIYLGHTSIREFLLRPRDQWEGQDSDIAYFSLNKKECHRAVGLACLRYLQQVEWEGFDLLNDLGELTSRYPLLGYASGYMSSHLLESDLTTEEASSHVVHFFNSDKFVAWVEFAIFLESGDTDHPPPPITFWDDTLQFWNVWGRFDPATGESMNMFNRIKQESFERHQTYGAEDSRAARLALISHHIVCALGDGQQEALGGDTGTVTTKRTMLGIEDQGLHGVVRGAMAKQQGFGLRQLAIISPSIKSILKKTEALIDPLEVLLRSMEESLKGMSFLSLMAFGRLVRPTRPKQALKIYEAALSRVSGRRDLREAWVHAMLGDCLRLYDDIEDNESAERHYSTAMDILRARSTTPLTDFWWSSAARCRVESLMSLDREDEALVLASEVEDRLMNNTASGSNGSVAQEMLNLGIIYYDENLNEDVDRILGHLARGTTELSLLDRASTFQILERLAWAMDSLGKSSEAKDTWIKAKEFVDANTADGKMFLNFARYRIARIHYNDGLYQDAERELSGIDIASFSTYYHINEFKRAVDCQFSTYMMVRKRDKAIEVLHHHLPTIEGVFAEDGMPFNSELWFVVGRLLSHGEFAESEKYIRQMLSRLHWRQEFNKSEEIDLYEALASSLRLQTDRPKRLDPYDQYLACIELAGVTCSGLLAARLHVGLGMTCAAGDRPKEASEAFERAAADCQSCLCGRGCIIESHQLLFRALAYQQERNVVGAILLLSQMVWLLDGVTPICQDWANDNENYILLVVGHMCLAEVFDGSGNLVQGNEHRKQALEILQREFEEAFDGTIPPRRRKLGLMISRWARSYQALILGRMEGKVGSEFWYEMFPTELLWPVWDESAINIPSGDDIT
ncbi:hypothetical protein ACJZ2D_016260 [Fusarium nematophilum]